MTTAVKQIQAIQSAGMEVAALKVLKKEYIFLTAGS